MHDVTILHHIFFTFDVEQTSFAHGSFTTIFDEVFVLDDLRSDKALFKVGVNDTSTLRSLPTALVGPSTHFDFTSGDVGFEVKHLVGCLDETVDTTLFQTHIFEEFLTLFVGFEFGNVGFCLSCHNEDFSSFVLHRFAHTLHIFVARSGRTFVHVAHIEHGL